MAIAWRFVRISFHFVVSYFVKENKLYHYADDNTLSHSGPDLSGLVKSLETESAILIDDNKGRTLSADHYGKQKQYKVILNM
jgi:hypothetical protein